MLVKWQNCRRAPVSAAACITLVFLLLCFIKFQSRNSNKYSIPAHPTSPESEDSLSGRPKCSVTKVSMLYGAHQVPQLEAALRSHQRHSERFGCPFATLEYDVISRRKLYSKHYFLLATMLQELSKPVEYRQQWLMWVDADSIVLNPALSPDIFLPPTEEEEEEEDSVHGGVYALVTADHNGLNSGVFYLRVHADSVDLLTRTLAYPLAHPAEDLGWFGEQAAMAHVIQSIEAANPTGPSGIVWMPRIWFNAYEFEHGFEGQPGAALVHFAGLAGKKLTHMTRWLDELQQNPAKWEIPLHQTFYEEAISRFWKEYVANVTAQRTKDQS